MLVGLDLILSPERQWTMSLHAQPRGAAMTPDELRCFLLPHTAEICRTTPALFRYIPGRENHFGSGVLLRVGETPFMLTAAHVADEFRDLKWKGIFFGTPDLEPLSVGTVKFLCSKPGKDPFRSDDPIDVAVVELSQEVAGKLSEFMRLPVRGRPPPRPTNAGAWNVLG